jgi:hypothetical protein
MSNPTKMPAVADNAMPPDPYPDYRPVYNWLFQAWLIMFIAVICLSLVIYLLHTLTNWMQ